MGLCVWTNMWSHTIEEPGLSGVTTPWKNSRRFKWLSESEPGSLADFVVYGGTGRMEIDEDGILEDATTEILDATAMSDPTLGLAIPGGLHGLSSLSSPCAD